MTNWCLRRRLRNRKRWRNWCGKRWRVCTSWKYRWQWRFVPDRIGGIWSDAVDWPLWMGPQRHYFAARRVSFATQDGHLKVAALKESSSGNVPAEHLNKRFLRYTSLTGVYSVAGIPDITAEWQVGLKEARREFSLGGAHEQYFAGVGHQ